MLITHVQNLIQESEGVHIAKEIAKNITGGFVSGINPINIVKNLADKVKIGYHSVGTLKDIAVASSKSEPVPTHHIDKTIDSAVRIATRRYGKETGEVTRQQGYNRIHNLIGDKEPVEIPKVDNSQKLQMASRIIGNTAGGITGDAALTYGAYKTYDHFKHKK